MHATTPSRKDVTLGVLLMRHCTHFHVYVDKLATVDCRRLITNARWGFGVEVIDLRAPRIPYTDVPIGWYACWCGAIGSRTGPPEHVTPNVDATVHEVFNCPTCMER